MEDTRGGGAVSAIFGKLLDSLSGKKHASPKENPEAENRARQLLHPQGRSVPVLSQSRIRVVVFRDEKGAKQLVFDSQQIAGEDGAEEQCSRSLRNIRCGDCLESSLSSSGSVATSASSHSAGWASQSGKTSRRRGFLVKRPSTDSELLGEMMFGSMPMKVVGNTVKVHYIRSTDKLMLSKVFTACPKPLGHCSLTDFTNSCPLSGHSLGSSSSGRGSHRSFSADPRGLLSSNRRISPDSPRPHSSSTLGVPISKTASLQLNHSPLSSSPRSPSSPMNSYNPLSSSLSRRIQRSRTTSLENPSELYRKVLKPLDQHSSSSGGRRKRKYAIGFIICLNELGKPDIRHFQCFLFSHFPLIDAHLEKLKLGVEEAFDGRRSGQVASDHITRAYEVFLDDFMALYKAPRIESPVWLGLVSCVDQRKQLCVQFMEELSTAISDMDTKENKYFLSSLLTAVLSHHLAWVFTVTRQQVTDGNGRHGKQSSKSLGVLAESHPYNPLWAQLSDLLGAVSYPLKMARTVVTGSSVATVSRLLYLLTYFIRCSEVEPGFTPDMDLLGSPLATQNVKIPGSVHTSADDLIYQLEDHETYGSRASSVTVMSDPDRNSLFSPYASPVSQGMDTPIIRTYPFGIRTTPHSVQGVPFAADVRKGSHSETDSLDSLHMQHSQLHTCGMGLEPLNMGTGPTQKRQSTLNRSGDLPVSQSTMTSSSKKVSPLLFSSGTVVRSDSNLSRLASSKIHCAPPSCEPIGDEVSDRSCASSVPLKRHEQELVCTDTSKCLPRDGFMTFDPNATKSLLSPDHTHHGSLPSHTSSSSLDSGYDHSLSLTDSCRESCTEFISSSSGYAAGSGGLGGGPFSYRSSNFSNFRMPSSRAESISGSSNAGHASYCDLNLDSGLGGHSKPVFMLNSMQQDVDESSQNVDLQELSLSHTGACDSRETSVEAGGLMVSRDSSARDKSCSPQASFNSGSTTLYRERNSEEASMTAIYSESDPECSLRSVNRPGLSLGKGSSTASNSSGIAQSELSGEMEEMNQEGSSSPSLPSPLSPDPTNHQLDLDADVSASVKSLSLPSDPTKALPPRKVKNHFHSISRPSPVGGENEFKDADPVPGDVGLNSWMAESSPSISHCSKVVNSQESGGLEFQVSCNSSSDAPFSSSCHAQDDTSDPSCVQTSPHPVAVQQFLESRYGIPLSTFEVSVSTCPHSHTTTSAASLSASPVLSPSQAKFQQPSSLTGVESLSGSEADSGRGTKTSLHECESNFSSKVPSLDVQFLPELSGLSSYKLQPRSQLNPGNLHSNVRASSSPPLIGHFRPEDEEEQCSLGRGDHQPPLHTSSSASNLLSMQRAQMDDRDYVKSNSFYSLPATIVAHHSSTKDDQTDTKNENDEELTGSLSTQSLKKYRNNPSLLQQQLQEHKESLLLGDRPHTLDRFSNFEDVPLPDLEEFHLDSPMDYHARAHEEAESHHHRTSDFGHSLFVGVSPKYLPDFVLHGTTQTMDQELQEKLLRDLAHAIKYPVIEEPVDIGVGIVADTANWTVKYHAVTKSLQTNDVLVGSADGHASRAVRQMLASVKHMHAMDMPPDFCLSYLEDSLMSLNEQSILLANALLEKGGLDSDLSEILPDVMKALNLSSPDLILLLPLAALNSTEPDMAARLNHLHMQKVIGKHFI